MNWYTHTGEVQEGPFSLEEMKSKILEKTINGQTHIWATGMPSWKKAEECPEFEAAFAQLKAQAAPQLPPRFDAPPKMEVPPRLESVPAKPAAPAATAPAPIQAAPVAVEPVVKHTPAPAPAPAPPVQAAPVAEVVLKPTASSSTAPAGATAHPSNTNNNKRVDELSVFLEMPKTLPERTQAIDVAQLKSLKKETANAQKAVKQSQTPGPDKTLSIVAPLVLLLVGLATASFLYFKMTTRALAPIPGMSDGDFERLKTAVSVPLANGERIEIAASEEDPAHPRLHIASNMADGTRFNVTLRGVPGTLLRPFKPATISSSPLKSFHAATDRIEVPSGEYQISIAALGSAKVLASTKLFLGGQRDTNYQTALEHTNSQNQQKADAELKLMKEAIPALEGFEGILQSFASARTKPQAQAAQKKWDDLAHSLPQNSPVWNSSSDALTYYGDAGKFGHEAWDHLQAAQKLYAEAQTKKPAEAAKLNGAIQEEVSKSRDAINHLTAEIQKPHPLEAQ
jgi:hypothetical protein